MRMSKQMLRGLVREELNRFKRGRRLSEDFHMSHSGMNEVPVGTEVTFDEFEDVEDAAQAYTSLHRQGHQVRLENGTKLVLTVTRDWEHEEVEEMLMRGEY